MEKTANLEWLIEVLLNEIKYSGEKHKWGIRLKGAFFTNTFLETIEKVIQEYNLEIER